MRKRRNLENDFTFKTPIIAHRGFSACFPENTLIAFKKAIELGADWVECDLQASRDNGLIVLHDATVDRTSNGSGWVSEMEYNELRALDVGSWFDSIFSDEKEPSFDEVLELCKGKVKILLHLRFENSDWAKSQIFVSHTIKELMDYDFLEDIVVASHDFRLANLVKIFCKNIETGVFDFKVKDIQNNSVQHLKQMIRMIGREAHKTGINTVGVFWQLIDSKLLELIKGYGIRVFVWTVDDEDTMKELTKLGVVGIVTNRPDIANTGLLPS